MQGNGGASSSALVVHIHTAEGEGSDQVGIVQNTAGAIAAAGGGQVNVDLVFCDDAVSYDPLSPFQVSTIMLSL